MTRRSLAVLLASLAVAAGVALWLRRPPPGRGHPGALRGRRAAGSERRASDAVAGVSERFAGHGLDRRRVKQLVAFHVLRGE